MSVLSPCNEAFSQSSALKRHNLTYTGEKKFTCKHFDRGFSQSTDLMTHKISHREEKQFTFTQFLFFIFFVLLSLTDTQVYQWIKWPADCTESRGRFIFLLFMFLLNMFSVFTLSSTLSLCMHSMLVALFSFKTELLRMCSLFKISEHPVSKRVCFPQFEGILFALARISKISLYSSSFIFLLGKR